MKTAIQTRDAPEAIGTYSQAVRADDTVYLSGQIGLDPATMQLAEGIDGQTHRVFRNLAAVAAAAGSSLDQAVRMTVYLTDLAHFARVNEIMAQYVREPFPARAAVGVSESGQVGLDPATMQLAGGIAGQPHGVSRTPGAAAAAAGSSLDQAVRMTVYLTDLAHFARVNEIMAQYVREPFPARAAVGVSGLPRGALVEIDAILRSG